MPLRERLKNFKGRLEKARQALGSEDGLAQPTSSLSKVKNVQPTINPALESPTTPVASGSIPEPAAAPSTSETTRPDQTWACLMTFLRILDNCSGAFGPLRMVIDGLIQCINMHEVSAISMLDLTPRLHVNFFPGCRGGSKRLQGAESPARGVV